MGMALDAQELHVAEQEYVRLQKLKEFLELHKVIENLETQFLALVQSHHLLDQSNPLTGLLGMHQFCP